LTPIKLYTLRPKILSINSDSSASPIPDECDEEDLITHVVGKKPLLGKVWRDRARGDYTRYRCYNYGIEYKSGDAVYIESQRPDQPYYICCIQVRFGEKLLCLVGYVL
jgi:hypothetical protein